jgi:hypothetical protein
VDTEKFTRYADSPKAATNDRKLSAAPLVPSRLKFNSHDLLLLSFWNKNGRLLPSARRVLQMPKRE